MALTREHMAMFPSCSWPHPFLVKCSRSWRGNVYLYTFFDHWHTICAWVCIATSFFGQILKVLIGNVKTFFDHWHRQSEPEFALICCTSDVWALLPTKTFVRVVHRTLSFHVIFNCSFPRALCWFNLRLI